MKTIDVHEAKFQLAQLVRAVLDGTEPKVAIAVDGIPAVLLVPYAVQPGRVLGIDRGLVTIADDFEGPLPF